MAVRIDTAADIPSIRMQEQGSNPSNPDSGYQSLFVKSDGLYLVNASGTVSGLTEWQDYSVTWKGSSSNPSIGNGILYSRYRRIGSKTIEFRISLLIGSTTNAGSGNWSFTLPTSITGSANTGWQSASAYALDNGTSWYNGAGIIGMGGVNEVGIILGAQSLVSHANPFSWADGDRLVIYGSYEEE